MQVASIQVVSLRRSARWLCFYLCTTVLVNIPALCFASGLGLAHTLPVWLYSFYCPPRFYYIRNESRVVELSDVGLVKVTADSHCGIRVIDYLRPHTFKPPTAVVLPTEGSHEPTTLFVMPIDYWGIEDAYMCGDIGDADCVSIVAWGWPFPAVRRWRALYRAYPGSADMLRTYGSSIETNSGWQPEWYRGTEILWLGAAVNGAIASGAIASLYYGKQVLRSRKRKIQSRCLHCGYKISGISICPECGTSPTQ
jgi:hypothetical protein